MPVFRSLNLNAHILDQRNGTRNHTGQGHIVRLLVSGSHPKGQELLTEEHKAGGNEGQQQKLHSAHLGEEGGQLKVGTPVIAGASVEAEVVEQFRADKVWAFKMKRRKSYRRTIGHRQNLTKVKVTAIVEK